MNLPLFFASPAQINFALPDDIGEGDQRLTVSCQGLPDVQATFTVGRNAPGLFHDTQSYAAVTHEDGTVLDLVPGEAYVIEPGHDAEVLGDESFVGFEFEQKAAEEYARR